MKMLKQNLKSQKYQYYATCDNLVNIAATKISAGVSTGIGSHVDDIEDKGDDQFEISDGRSVDEVFNALKDHGLQPVMNDYIYL